MASIHASPGATRFGEDAAQYDFARPPYPADLFDWLKARCSLGPESDCFEIGAGTGLATLPVLATPVRTLLAIEPDQRLADRLRDKAAADPRLTIEIARFESASLPAGLFDFGFAAMSLHWLARMKALARVRDALKPGGWFAMWWNVYHNAAEPDAFGRATAHLFAGVEQDPNATSSHGAFALDAASRLGELRAAGFVEIEHRLFRQEIVFTPERVAALYATFSRVRMAPPDVRQRLHVECERIAREQFGGEVRRPVTCSAFVGRKEPDSGVSML
ncbi:MAG: class I SAM-dependent methyltransferase [Hyphomonadaceae bacterium]